LLSLSTKVVPTFSLNHSAAILARISNVSLSNSKQEQQLADAILLLIKDKKLYNKYQEESLNRTKDFSQDKIMKEWINIIEE